MTDVDPKEFMNRMYDSISVELEKIKFLFPDEQDPVLTIHRGHLLSEYYLDKIITLNLNFEEMVSKKENLSFKQKVTLVENMAFLPDSVIRSLNNLNKVRNSLAHELEAKIETDEIIKIFEPMGKEFRKIKEKYSDHIGNFLEQALNLIFRDLHGHIFWLEQKKAQEKDRETS